MVFNFTVQYYKNYDEVHSWKAEPKSITVEAKNKKDAKRVFKGWFPNYIILSVVNTLNG